MYLVRDIMYCKPGKVRPMIEKFVAMAKLSEKAGMGKMRVLSDLAGEQYWTVISEMEIETMDAFVSMDATMNPEIAKQFEEIMKGYHDLIDRGRREIYRIEG